MIGKAAWAAAATAIWSGGAVAQETRAQAMDYLAANLPKATAANPAYLTKADGTLTRWLTDEIVFESGPEGAVIVTMRDRFIQTKAGKTIEAKHVARFAMNEVTVEPLVEPGDVTPAGEPANGILFVCKTPGCVAAVWGEAPSRADKSDVSLQEPATRARILAAFRRLQAP